MTTAARYAVLEVVLDMEIALNNRSLYYVEDDIQLSVLTANSLLFLWSNHLPELEPHHLREFDLRKRAKYLRMCKQTSWTRWTTEYLQWLRERHRMKHMNQTMPLAKGEVVIIKDEKRNRNKWKIGIVEDLISGRDELPNFERGKEHSNRRYNTFTNWSCHAIGRMYRLLRNSTPKPQHSGPGGEVTPNWHTELTFCFIHWISNFIECAILVFFLLWKKQGSLWEIIQG